MNLQLRSIVAAGDLSKERLTLVANADLDVGDYIVAQTNYSDDILLASIQHAFWFPFKEIKKGDLLVVYTKAGLASTRPVHSGVTSHFYYMGLDHPIWHENDKGAIVMRAPDWVSKRTQELQAGLE